MGMNRIESRNGLKMRLESGHWQQVTALLSQGLGLHHWDALVKQMFSTVVGLERFLE